MAIFQITRSIGIDVGHRVPTHGSKCWNWHGHRYTINATCEADTLQEDGAQTDMVLDFGFLKEIMMQQCDALCDHGMVVWLDDPLLFMVVGESALRSSAEGIIRAGAPYHLVKEDRRFNQTKVLIVPFIPTAERLSQFWFNLMEAEVISLSDCMARLTKVEVWETPNCSAVFPAGTQ